MLVLLNLLVIPLMIDGINIPLSKDTEDDICTFEDDLCRHGDDGDDGDGGDNRTSSKGRRSRRSGRIKTSRYSYPLRHLTVQF
jgi:hypothetical protein